MKILNRILLKKYFEHTAIFFVLFITMQPVVAQDSIQKRWAIEARGGANYAVNKLGNANLDNGYGFEGIVAFRVIGSLAIYAGWGYNHFTSDQYFEDSKLDFEETGYTFGLQLINLFPNSKVGYLIKGGAIYNHIETENSAGVIINDTGHGFGWQGGIGINLPLGSRFRLTPELRYRSLSRNISLNNTTEAVELNYISASVGVAFLF